MSDRVAMQVPKFRDKYLDTFFREKNLREKVYHVSGPENDHSIPTGVVLEHIALTRGREREQIKDVIRKIDFKNGDLHHFFEHLAKGIAAQYDQQGRQATKEHTVKDDLIKLGNAHPQLREHIKPILRSLKVAQYSIMPSEMEKDLRKIFGNVISGSRGNSTSSTWAIDVVPEYGEDGIVEVHLTHDKIMVSSEGGRQHLLTASAEPQIWEVLKRDFKKALKMAERNSDAPMAYFEAVMRESKAPRMKILREV
jgi:hypothetical protein